MSALIQGACAEGGQHAHAAIGRGASPEAEGDAGGTCIEGSDQGIAEAERRGIERSKRMGAGQGDAAHACELDHRVSTPHREGRLVPLP